METKPCAGTAFPVLSSIQTSADPLGSGGLELQGTVQLFFTYKHKIPQSNCNSVIHQF